MLARTRSSEHVSDGDEKYILRNFDDRLTLDLELWGKGGGEK